MRCNVGDSSFDRDDEMDREEGDDAEPERMQSSNQASSQQKSSQPDLGTAEGPDGSKVTNKEVGQERHVSIKLNDKTIVRPNGINV